MEQTKQTSRLRRLLRLLAFVAAALVLWMAVDFTLWSVRKPSVEKLEKLVRRDSSGHALLAEIRSLLTVVQFTAPELDVSGRILLVFDEAASKHKTSPASVRDQVYLAITNASERHFMAGTLDMAVEGKLSELRVAGKNADAIKALEKEKRQIRQIKVDALVDVAVGQAAIGGFESAIFNFKRALEFIDKATDPEAWSGILMSLGYAYESLGIDGAAKDTRKQFGAAAEAYREILKVRRQIGKTQDRAMIQVLLGDVLRRRAKMDQEPEAEALLREAAQAYRDALTVLTPDFHAKHHSTVSGRLAETQKALEKFRKTLSGNFRLQEANIGGGLATRNE